MAAPARLLPALLLVAALLCWRAYGDTDDWNLEDALGDLATKKPEPKPPRKPSSGSDDFNLDDYFDIPSQTTTKRPRTTTKSPAKKPDQSIWDLLDLTTTKSPKTTKSPPKKKPAKGSTDFDLSDAVDDQNDGQGGKRNSNTGGGGDFSDSDLSDILDDGSYHPDKKRGGGRGGGSSDSDTGSLAETGTIAGIASALAMALIGAVSSYISYQQKKFCFSIQQGLNAEYVKGENMEVVVAEEPQVKYTALNQQSAEPPPSSENAKV
ncbi:CD99 antigen-like protein 2 isoform X2 [Rhinatrema bivittatum]|uniref:CD99 antigen-like protein 2 isoform X2 n=1 Tax=Rhinatrema bivittatum TaxID=194408 RepID=UPI00112831E0|nr:CD99 antigen-like protein 2 isoform X2 [Rhinatrema bivittatum]